MSPKNGEEVGLVAWRVNMGETVMAFDLFRSLAPSLIPNLCFGLSTVGQNSLIVWHPLSHFPTTQGLSERVSEGTSKRANE